MNNFEFGEKMKSRTKAFAVQIVKFYKTLPRTDEARVLGRQVLRSGTSTAASLTDQLTNWFQRHGLVMI